MIIKKAIWIISLFVCLTGLSALSYSDAEFCQKKELWPLLDKHSDAIRDSALAQPSKAKWLNLYMSCAEHQSDTLTVLNCLEQLALEHSDLDRAANWISLSGEFTKQHKDYPSHSVMSKLLAHFDGEADHFLLQTLQSNPGEDSLYSAIAKLKHYNNYIEDLAKALLDMISVERDDSLAFALTQKFYQTFSYSKWCQAAYYFELAHYTGQRDYAAAFTLMDQKAKLSPAHRYLTTLFLVSPTLRRDLMSSDLQLDWWGKALDLIDFIPVQGDSQLVLYDYYSPAHWQTRLTLQKAKIMYYRLIASYGYCGDEDSLFAIMEKPSPDWQTINSLLNSLEFANNDSGERAELAFWKGRLHALLSDKKSLTTALDHFSKCLVSGAPRKKYDKEAQQFSENILSKMKIKSSLLFWQRKRFNYDSIVFDDITAAAGFKDNRETRVALGDYDNDSYADILLNGRRLFHNEGALMFKEVTDTIGLSNLNSNGGLFADFNLDGKLDLMTTSSASEGNGERFMKNNGDRFVPVNERAGDIDDSYPTEGAAWIDCFRDAYPDLYCANYEKWNERNGYDDRFWNNETGYFADKTKAFGFLNPDYTHDPGQAGRGVAPADFDNDGEQEIYVTNYRLDRNFLWDRQDTTFTDIAALNGLQGILKQGYYGHSIGADWGDFDNDGDLDLFIANLAHPRYITISDISMLLRNDGERVRVIEGDTIRYWQFTDVTQKADITYDELHSDPLWFDADNDGWLDLFITSVYENDRSYLYHNNGNGTFTDITWLAGARVYNGWGNACADFDQDGNLDLVVGSGNGTQVLHNKTRSDNRSISLKPVWEKGKVVLLSSSAEYAKHPNSPAYGTRVILTLKNADGRISQLIRELSSAKGTTSQTEQVLHFGIGRKKIVQSEIFNPTPVEPESEM
jgi:hypothetical protein